MNHVRQLQRSAALVGSVLLATFGAQAAGNFTIQNGTWIVTSEADGNPGRGMAIDVQNGVLGMQVYNYDNIGQPTFHLSAGPMNGNHYSGTLTRYKNGRYFGSGPLDAVEVDEGTASAVSIDFTSSSTGTIQFPGESPVAISRYNFDMIPPGTFSRVGVGERWLLAELDDTDKPVNALLISTTTTGYSPGPMDVPALSSALSLKDGTGSFTTCSYANATQVFKCDIQFDGTPGKRTLQWSKHLEGMSGTISSASACTYSPCPPTTTTRKVVGMRLGLDSGVTAVNAQMDAPAASMTPPFYHVAPDPGTWIVNSELTGKPGRGMAIDVQYDTLGMQVYNYEKSGAATFHLAVASYKDGQAKGHLKRYEGGRYFGGPAQSGHEVADVGEVKLNFTTPRQGTIQFPGEFPVPIQRYEFGATNPAPESLFGGWMVFDPAKKQLKYYELSTTWSTAPDEATGTGALLSIRCKYLGDPLSEAVRCRDQTTVSIDDYFFTPVNGRAIGSHKTSGTSTSTDIYVLRVKDRNGTLAGLGKF